MKRFSILFILGCISKIGTLVAFEKVDVEKVIHAFTESWNRDAAIGMGELYLDNGTFINIFGKQFVGNVAIENRHIEILSTFLKQSTFKVTDIQLRELVPEVVLAYVSWEVDGFRKPGSDTTAHGEKKRGIFTHVMVRKEGQWKIASSQNTMFPG